MVNSTSTQLEIKPETALFQPANGTYDACIIGAGVAGSVLASYLGRKGKKVLVIERDLSEPDKIIGELLQPGGVMKLMEMGFGDVLDGIDAQNVKGYALFMGNHNFTIPYPEINSNPITGRGFRYGKFIMNLRKKMAEYPSVTIVEASANELIESADGKVKGVSFKTKDGKEHKVRTHFTVATDGSFSRFRKSLNDGDIVTKGFMVGLLLKNFNLPFPGHGHVILSGETPVLSYPVSSTETRVLVDFPGEKSPKQNGQAYEKLIGIAKKLPVQMQAAYLSSINRDKLKAMPNMMVSANPVRKSGAIILGDALNMRHPLTGGGMTVALTDVQLLGNLLDEIHDFADSTSVENVVNEFYNVRHKSDSTINILADALYEVMSSPDLKKACYEYLSRGSKYANGPVSILSAVSRDKELLIREFFAVAMFGAGNILKPYPKPASILRSYHMLQDAVNIITPLLLNEKPSLPTKVALKMGGLVFPNRKHKINNKAGALA